MSQYPPGQQPQYPQGYPQQPSQPGNPYPGYPQGQYPAPYSPYQIPQANPMAYAQAGMQGMGSQFSRAGLMLIVTGVLMGLCGLSCGVVAMMPLDQVMANAQMDPELAALMTPQLMKLALIVLAAGSFIYALLAVILGIFVRRGSKGATIAAIVVTGLVIVYLIVNMLSGLVRMGSMGGQAVLGMCVVIVPLVISVWQMVWLVSALRSAGPMRAMAGQMQYWQMMQMQQYQQMMAAQQQQQMGAQQQGQAGAPQQQNSEVRSQNSEEGKGGGDVGGQGPPSPSP